MQKQEIIFGIHAVKSILQQHPQRILQLTILHGRQDKQIEEIVALAKSHALDIEILSRKEMDKRVQDANHQGVLATCGVMQSYCENDLNALIQECAEEPFLLILDQVQDPHNLGACLRTADAAGVHAVIAPRDNSASITPVVRKVASGATESVPFIQVTNLARTINDLKKMNIWVYGTSDQANKTIYQADLTGPLALVLGAEGKGLRRLTQETCDDIYNIPMAGFVSSLNVSVATGVCIFEAVRQRTTK